MEEKKSKIKQIYDKVSLICGDVGMWIIVVMCVLTFRHAIGRYFFSAPLKGNIDIVCFGIIVAIFLTIMCAFNKDEHVSVGLLADHLPKRAQNGLYIFVGIIILAFLAACSYETFLYAPEVNEFTNVISLPKQPVYWFIAICFLLFCIGAAIDIVIKITKFTNKMIAVVVIAISAALFAVIVFAKPMDAFFKRSDSFTVGIVGLILFLVLMFMKMPVGLAMGVAGFLIVGVFTGWKGAFGVLAQAPFASLNNYTWSTVPMFVLMGFLAKNTRLAEDFYFGVRQWIGHFPGGMLHAVIIGNGAFGACSGDSIGAAVTFCSISLPETRKYGYADPLTLGCIAGGSVLSCVIPPSMPFIIYGATTQTSIGHMFVAGIIPGLILVGIYMLMVGIISHARPHLAPRSKKVSAKEALKATPAMLFLIVVFVVIIGGIYLGVFSPTEAGSFGVVAVTIIGIIRKQLTLKKFILSLREAAGSLGMIGLLLVGSAIFQRMIVLTGLTAKLSEYMIRTISSPKAFMLIVGLLMLILGCFIDSLPMLLILSPLLYPVAMNLGVPSVQLGVFITLMCMCGTLTPPVGIVVYALSGQVKDVSMGSIFKGVIPFVIVLFAFTIMIGMVPELTTWLVGMMYG